MDKFPVDYLIACAVSLALVLFAVLKAANYRADEDKDGAS